MPDSESRKLFVSMPMAGRTNEDIMQDSDNICQRVQKMFSDEKIELIDSFDPEFNKSNDCKNNKSDLQHLLGSIEFMNDVNYIYFASDWENARGCKIEHECAASYFLNIVESLDIED